MTDESKISEVILNGLFEFGLGVGASLLVETIMPEPDDSRGWLVEAVEVTATVALDAVLIQTIGSFLVRRVTPENTSAGILLGWGMFFGQPNLHRKARQVITELKTGLIAVLTQQGSVVVKIEGKE